MCVFIHGRAGRGGEGSGRAGRILRDSVDEMMCQNAHLHRGTTSRGGDETRQSECVRAQLHGGERRAFNSGRLRVCVTKEGVSSADDSSEKSANNAPHQRPEFEARSRSGRSGAGDRGRVGRARRAGLRRRRRQLELILEINTKMPSRPTKVSATSDRDNVLFIPRRALGASPSPSPPIRFRSDPIPREAREGGKKKKRARVEKAKATSDEVGRADRGRFDA